MLILLFLLAIGAWGQPAPAPPVCPAGFTCTTLPMPKIVATAPPPITASAPAPVVTAGATAPAVACPMSFYAAGTTYNPPASPRFDGFYAIATPVTKCGKTFQAYSITMNVLTPSGGSKNLTFTSTTTTGMAIPMKQVGTVNIYAFGNVGVAATATATKLGSNWGGFATVPLPFWSMRFIPIGQNVNGHWAYGAALGRSW